MRLSPSSMAGPDPTTSRHCRAIEILVGQGPLCLALSRRVVVELLEEQFPAWARLPVRPVDVDGNDNTSFRLGDDLLVRLPSHDRYVAGVEKEHRWLPRLAPQLPRPIPEPVAKGQPTGTFPRIWSVYRWIEGEPAGVCPPEDPVAHYDQQTRAAIADLGDDVDADAATGVWDAALGAPYTADPVWLHGDVAPNNLLVRDGALSAVIDFGCSAVGDPACDTVLAWTLLDGQARTAFREQLPVDEATWARGRGWATWKALITLAWNAHTNATFTHECQRVLTAVIAEHTDGPPDN